ncbi:MAG TPA: DUF2946 family protein [Alphaproteobacteria bacterium]|nr:DUF2946 family protein [Alphaproteobacteria bacterium]
MGATLKKGASKSLSTWLALLALGVQLALPLSVGIEIAHHGAAPIWEAAAGDLCSVAHSHPAPHREKDGSGPAPTGACALCAALNVMHAFTDAPILALPIPGRAESSRPIAVHDDVGAPAPSAVYRSRAPPTVA